MWRQRVVHSNSDKIDFVKMKLGIDDRFERQMTAIVFHHFLSIDPLCQKRYDLHQVLSAIYRTTGHQDRARVV